MRFTESTAVHTEQEKDNFMASEGTTGFLFNGRVIQPTKMFPPMDPTPVEADPNGLSAHTPGAKMDAGKIPVTQGVIQYFPRALKAVAGISLFGANKYAWKGWEKVTDGINRYSNALGRHLLAEEIEGPIDAETQQLHASQVAWNSLARLELILRDLEEIEKSEKIINAMIEKEK